MSDELSRIADYARRAPGWRVRYVELPPAVAEFVNKAIKITVRDGTRRRDMRGKLMITCSCGPIWFFAGGEAQEEFYASLPGPQDTPGNRTQIYECGSDGIRYDEQQCKQFIPLLDKSLVLDRMAEI
jgi:hypothetical protein